MKKLNILWTTTNKDTIEKIIAMYSMAALKNQWWEKVNILVWGASAKLIAEDEEVQGYVQQMLDAGVAIEACQACAEQFGVQVKLRELRLDVKYLGEYLTNYIKADEKILTL